MEQLFKKIKIAFPKAVVQSEKNYVSFTFGGGIYYQLRVQKDKVRMMATNYPQKAKIGECLRLIKKHGIEGQDVNGKEIIFEVGARNPDIFTLRIEMPYNSGQLEKDSFNNGIVDSCAKFHDILLPLLNNFMKQPVDDLYALMGGTNNASPNKTKAAQQKAQVSSSTTIQQQIASVISEKFPDAEIKKIDRDNYLDIHLPSVNPKKGTHLGINTAKGLIKIVFYCREDSFNEQVLSNSKKIESYSQGLRIKDNPTYNTVEKAIEASIDFVLEIKRTTGNKSEATKPASVQTESKKQQPKDRVVKTSQEGSDFEEMIKAYKNGDLEKVAKYIEKGNPILQFSQDESLIENELLTVCVADPVDLDLLKKFIKRGDDLNIRNNDSDKYTAVHYCAWDGKVEALSILLKNGALPDIVGEDGRTALHLAAANGFVDIVELLLKAGADIDRRIPNDFNTYYSNDGSTAIREALYNQNWDVIDLLIKNRADLTNLTEPCCQSLEGTNDLFEIIRISNEKGLYPDGNFNETKLNKLEKEIRGDSNPKEDVMDSFEVLKRNLNTNTEDLTKAVLDQEYEAEEVETEKDTQDEDEEAQDEEVEEESDDDEKGFPVIRYRKPSDELKDVVNVYFKQWQKNSTIYAWRMGITGYLPEFVEELISDDVCPVFAKEQIDAIYNKIYNNKLIPILDYAPAELLNHTKRVWWIVPFCIIKEDIASMIFVDKDGFYALIENEGEVELRMIFSWDKVDVLEYQTDLEDDPNVCRLTLHQENGGYLTFDEFISETEDDNHGSYLKVIEAIWEARKDTIEASRGKSIWLEGEGGETFKIYQHPLDLFKPENEETEELEEEEDESVEKEIEVEEDLEVEEEENSEEEETNSFYFGKFYEKQYFRFQEIAEKTGILINQIKAEPNSKERDELWDIVRVFADRIYQIDAEKNPDKEELNTLCFYNIVALHWCDLAVNDKRFSFTNGRFRRDVLALALCFYARIDRSYDYYDHVKLQFIMPHMQFSVLLWSINSIVNLGQDNLFGMFTQEQAQKAQQLFTEMDKQNQASGGYGVVAPNKMPDNHPLKAIWSELFSLFSNVRIPYQFIRNYISLEFPKRSFLQGLLSGKGNNNPGANVTLLDEDKQINIAFLDLQIIHKQFPSDWIFINDLAFVSIYFATITDGQFSDVEKNTIYQLVGEWIDEEDESKLKKQVNDAFIKAKAEFDKDKSQERFEFALENIRRKFYVNLDYDKGKAANQLKLILNDLLTIAEADDEVKTEEIDLIDVIKNEWGVKWGNDEDENESDDDEENDDEENEEEDDDTDDESDGVEEKEREYREFIVTRQSSLTDDKIEYLISRDKILCLGSVTSITDRQAELLSKSKKYIYLEGLTSLTDSQVVAFSKHRGSGINLDGIVSFSDRQVEIISKHEGGLSLDGIISLSDKHAAIFSSHKGDLSLDGLTALSDKQSEYLSRHQGELSLDGVTYLSDKQAAFLANHDGDLLLDSLNDLNDRQAEVFSKHIGTLTLNGITSLTDKQIILLSKHQGSLCLNGMVSLSDKSLENLGAHKGEYLSLDGLTSLSNRGANALARYKGDLHLNGVTTLSDQAALALAMHEGELSMDGLTSLSDRAIEVLAEKGISIKQEDDSDEEEDDDKIQEDSKRDEFNDADTEFKISDTHVEFFLYLTMGKTDDDLSDKEISAIVNFLVDKNKNHANRNIIEIIFDESFKWWVNALKDGTVYDLLNENLHMLDEFSNDEKLTVLKNLKTISLLDKKIATNEENELIQILSKRWGIQ